MKQQIMIAQRVTENAVAMPSGTRMAKISVDSFISHSAKQIQVQVCGRCQLRLVRVHLAPSWLTNSTLVLYVHDRLCSMNRRRVSFKISLYVMVCHFGVHQARNVTAKVLQKQWKPHCRSFKSSGQGIDHHHHWNTAWWRVHTHNVVLALLLLLYAHSYIHNIT